MNDTPLQILIVEDEPAHAEAIRRAFQVNGLNGEVRLATTLQEFRQRVAANPPDIALLDLNLPDGRAVEVLTSPPESGLFPILIMTSFGNEEIAVEAMKAGALDYIVKSPEAFTTMPRTVERALREWSLLQERKRFGEALQESEEQYRTAIESSNDGVAIIEGEALRYVNQKYCEMYGYEKPEEVLGRSFTIVLHPDDREKLTDYNHRRQRGEPVPSRYEYKGIRKDGEIVYIEASSTQMPFQGKSLSLAYLRDITDKKKAQARMEQTLENLRKAIGGIIQVISATVETRDPYTAGHQQRVSDLARAIGQEMKLNADRVDGLRMAGIIHDLGKISIPAEILSKPIRLTELEYQLIRIHPQVGYDILQGIEFPWPIATMVLQHHERIDGSGYPRGLKGEAILQEARILMVADVVEAMASYRPYRPALGIEAALEEIEKNAGVLYDREVVEVCLQLFREKGYQLE